MRGTSFGVRPEKKTYVRRPKEQPFKPYVGMGDERHARAVHDAGGKHFELNLHIPNEPPASIYAPGCGVPIHVPGTNGGTMPCGTKLSGEPQFCEHCSRNQGLIESLTDRLLEAEPAGSGKLDPEELKKGTADEQEEHNMPKSKAAKTAEQHLRKVDKRYYSTVEKCLGES